MLLGILLPLPYTFSWYFLAGLPSYTPSLILKCFQGFVFNPLDLFFSLSKCTPPFPWLGRCLEANDFQSHIIKSGNSSKSYHVYQRHTCFLHLGVSWASSTLSAQTCHLFPPKTWIVPFCYHEGLCLCQLLILGTGSHP